MPTSQADSRRFDVYVHASLIISGVDLFLIFGVVFISFVNYLLIGFETFYFY